MNLKREKTAEILPEKFKFWGETFHTVKIKYVMSQAVEIVNSTAQGEVNLTLLSKTNFQVLWESISTVCWFQVNLHWLQKAVCFYLPGF